MSDSLLNNYRDGKFADHLTGTNKSQFSQEKVALVKKTVKMGKLVGIDKKNYQVW